MDGQLHDLGFIGLGAMGSPMVQRFLDSGYAVTVWNRTPDCMQPLLEKGAVAAESPRRLAERSEAVLLSVTDDAARDAVSFGDDGLLAGLRPGSLVIDLSTVSPQASRRLYREAQVRGADMIDAPVAGSTRQVEQRELAIFAGGDRHVYEVCKPLLDVLGDKVFYLGESGMGAMMKLVVNTILGLGMLAIAEGIAVGLKGGLEQDLLVDVLAQLPALTGAQKVKVGGVKTGAYPTQFLMSLIHKDFGLVLDEAAATCTPMPVTAVGQQVYAGAMVDRAGEDFSAVIEYLRELAGIPRGA